MKGKTIYLNIKQAVLLDYIISMYQELHEDSWEEGINPEEKVLTKQILKKFAPRNK